MQLADALDDEFTQGRISNYNGRKAAAELRRLHEVNQDLLALAERIARLPEHGHYLVLIDEARTAIAKATGEKT
jgi:hypothetical protein